MNRILAVACILLGFIAGLLVPCLSAQVPTQEGAMGTDATALALSCRVERGPVASVQFYRLLCGGPETFTIAADAHTQTARWLSGRVGRRWPLHFGDDDAEPQR